MTHFRFIPLFAILASATLLVACNTAPATPMGAATANSMATPDQMARMDAQMKTMQGMHEKMMNAKSPEERNRLMAEYRKTMQDGMGMMGGMAPGGMQGEGPMAGDMATRQKMMEKRMEMMQTMMRMMMDQMPPSPGKR